MLCHQRVGHCHLELCVREAVGLGQLQGGAPHHQDRGGGQAVQPALQGSLGLAKAQRLLDDTGKVDFFSMMSLKRHHSKKGNFVSSNAGLLERDFGYS